MDETTAFIGLDTAKNKIAVAVADDGRDGEVRFLGEIDNTPEAIRKLVKKLAGRHRCLVFCYEAGPTGYGLYRQITALGHACTVVAPSLIPTWPTRRSATSPGHGRQRRKSCAAAASRCRRSCCATAGRIVAGVARARRMDAGWPG